MEREKTEAAIEAILFAMGNAVSVDKIAAAIGHDTETTRKLVHQMMDQYNSRPGGLEIIDTIKGILDAGIPVMGHLGLTPQSINTFGGFKVQGKTEAAAKKLIEDAKAVEEAGAFLLVLECVPAKLAKLVTESINIPTIGIGAGAGCDGQVLVIYDMLGMFSDFKPKFVKHFANAGDMIREAVKTYIAEIDDGTFPAEEHCYKIDDEVIDKLY